MGKGEERLGDAARSGVYRVRRADALAGAAPRARLALARIDLSGVADKEALLARLASTLGFPAWFGGTWDALEDCLADLSWRAAPGHALLIEGQDALEGDDLGVLIDVLGAAAASWAQRGRPFFAAFVDPAHSLALPELPLAAPR